MRKSLLAGLALCLVTLSAAAYDLLPIHQFTHNDGKTGIPDVGQGWLEVTNDDWMPYIVDVDRNNRRVNIWPEGSRGGTLVRPGVVTYINVDHGFWTLAGPARHDFNLGVRPGQSTAIHIQGFREGDRYGAIANVNNGRRDIAATIVNPAYRSRDQLPYPERIHYPYSGPPEYINPPVPVIPPSPPPYYQPVPVIPAPPPPPPYYYPPVPVIPQQTLPPPPPPPYRHEPPSHNPFLQHRW